MDSKTIYTWFDFYKNENYQEYFNIRYSSFLNRLHGYFYSNPNCQSLEIGCGIASTTKFLIEKRDVSRSNINISDISVKILELASINLDKVIPLYNQYDLDIFNKDNFNNINLEGIDIDLIYSHGLLENYTTLQIKEILENISILKNVKDSLTSIHLVHSTGYENEYHKELRSLEGWKEVISTVSDIQLFSVEDITISNNKESDLIIKITH